MFKKRGKREQSSRDRLFCLQKRGRKAQVTLFIVIGLVILISTGLFLYFKGIIIKEVEIIQPEIMPVKHFIDSCIKGIAEDGIEKVGLTGGYIKFPDFIENTPISYLPTAPIGNLKTPYWWYDGISSIPTEDFIKMQLSDYVAEELKKCINNFEDFGHDFDIKELGGITAIVEFGKSDVIVKVNFPLEISDKLGKTIYKISKFSATIPVRLKAVYELAKAIMETENKQAFLEEKTIDLMALDNDIPTTDIEVTCGKKTWYLPEVKAKLQRLLMVNLPYIKIEGTEYDKEQYVPNPFSKETFGSSYFNYHYVWKVTEVPHPDMHVSFSYDNWPMEFNARPSDGPLLKSNSQKGYDMLSFFCLHVWHFTYDVVYPVKAAIIDDEAAGRNKYVFNFAFKVSVNHNQPSRANYATAAFENPDRITEDEFCSDLYNEISIYAEDAVDADSITKANLTLTCGGYTCMLGETEWLSYGAAAGIAKKMPYCVKGILRGKKQNYEDAEMFIETDIAGKAYTLFMTPSRLIDNYKVVKHPLDSPFTEENLGNDEKATILIKLPEKKFESYGIYPADGNFPVKLLAKDDYNYNISIYLVKNEQLVGGYKSEWKVSWDELRDAKTIKFHVVEKEFKDETENYLFIAGLDSYSKSIPKPELK